MGDNGQLAELSLMVNQWTRPTGVLLRIHSKMNISLGPKERATLIQSSNPTCIQHPRCIFLLLTETARQEHTLRCRVVYPKQHQTPNEKTLPLLTC